MIILLPKILGAMGLIIITVGIFASSREKEDFLFIIGGIGLLIYSIYLKDPIFIPLQIVFILASIFEIYKVNKNKQK